MQSGKVREVDRGDRCPSCPIAEIPRMLREVGGFERHVFAHDHSHDFLAHAFDLGRCAFEHVSAFGIDGDRQVMISESNPPRLLFIGGNGELVAQRDGGIIGGVHLANDALDAFRHDIGRDWGERIGQHDVEWQVEPVEQGDIRKSRIGLDAEERAVAGGAGCGADNPYRVALKGGADVPQLMRQGQGALTKRDGREGA